MSAPNRRGPEGAEPRDNQVRTSGRIIPPPPPSTLQFAADTLHRAADALDEAHEALAAYRDNHSIRWLLERLADAIEETEDAVSELRSFADDLDGGHE